MIPAALLNSRSVAQTNQPFHQHRVQSSPSPPPSSSLPPTTIIATSIKKNAAIIAATATLFMQSPAFASVDAVAATTFNNTCAGCHVGGGNIVRRDVTLKIEDLSKYGVDSVDALYDIIYSGRGSMPGYGEQCAPRSQCTFGPRLSDEQVKGVAEYVLGQAKAGWKAE